MWQRMTCSLATGLNLTAPKGQGSSCLRRVNVATALQIDSEKTPPITRNVRSNTGHATQSNRTNGAFF